jgi:hypothetical protein
MTNSTSADAVHSSLSPMMRLAVAIELANVVIRTNLKQFGELDDWEKAVLNNASKFLDRSAGWA